MGQIIKGQISLAMKRMKLISSNETRLCHCKFTVVSTMFLCMYERFAENNDQLRCSVNFSLGNQVQVRHIKIYFNEHSVSQTVQNFSRFLCGNIDQGQPWTFCRSKTGS